MPMSQVAGAAETEAVLVEETGRGRYQVDVHAAGATFVADEPVAFGGLGSGPNPYDLLGAALGSCTAMTLRLHADRRAWPLARVRVRVKHVRATLTARDRFEREITLEGDLDDAQRQRLLEVANRCPVHVTLERGADVRTQLVPVDRLDPAAPLAETGQHARHMNEAHLAEQAAGG